MSYDFRSYKSRTQNTIEVYLARSQQGALLPEGTVALISALNITASPSSRHGKKYDERTKQMKQAWASAHGDRTKKGSHRADCRAVEEGFIE
jgi:hypothetical protein